MNKDEMNRKIAEELDRIPRVKGDLPQNMFRAAYNSVRRHDLAVNPGTPAGLSLKKTLEQAKEMNPHRSPRYDQEFFGVGVRR